MLKLKKGLVNMLEQDTNNNPYAAEEFPLQPTPQPVHETQQVTTARLQPTTSHSEWRELLIEFLATAPEEVALKLVSCLDNNLIVQMLEEKKNDPYLKVALLLLSQKK
jgi:hypothetical protein